MYTPLSKDDKRSVESRGAKATHDYLMYISVAITFTLCGVILGVVFSGIGAFRSHDNKTVQDICPAPIKCSASARPRCEKPPPIRAPLLVRASEGPLYNTIPGETATLKLSSYDTDCLAELILGIDAPQASNLPLAHRHNASDELFYILEGSYEFIVDYQHYTLNAGDLLLIRKGSSIGHINPSTTQTARMLALFLPGLSWGAVSEVSEYINSLPPPQWDFSKIASIAGQWCAFEGDHPPQTP